MIFRGRVWPRRSFVGFSLSSSFSLFFFLLCRCSRVAEGRDRVSVASPPSAALCGSCATENSGVRRSFWFCQRLRFFFYPLHYLPLKRTFELQSLELLDQLGIFFLYFLLSFPCTFLDLVITPQYLNDTYVSIT